MNRPHRWVIAALATTTVLALSRPLMASEERNAVSVRGVCSEASTWEFTVNRDIGLELETHLETGVSDQGWQVEMWYQEGLVYHAMVQTEDDGGFEVRTVQRKLPGQDRLRFVTTNTVTGETCTAAMQHLF
jgi:hypothetical protein